MNVSQEVLSWGGLILLVLGTTVALTILLTNPRSLPRRLYQKQVDALEAECRFLFLDMSGAQIARYQIFVVLGVVALPLPFIDLEDPFNLLIMVIAVFLVIWMPRVRLRAMHEERVREIEEQLDTWLLLLANALKATPSLGEATAESAKIMRAPIGQELDLMLKEVKLGTPLDQAIMGMSDRIGSRSLAGALATILVGRQTGGDLSRILQESAATLREMARLEGVVRTKTAEGKTQAYVLGAIPFLLIGAIQMIDPNWLRPLGQTTLGFLIVVAAAILWVAAIFLARKILAVDI
ncbi:MAG: type II secretion system F family protein [Myxococcota bacterium]